MRLGRLDLNLLVALDRLLLLKSITAAAEEMHLSQSAMSSALRRLRDYFDDPLLVQVGKKMELTPRAEALRRPIGDVLARIESATTSGLTFDATRSTRQFTIILSDYALNVLAPHVLALAAEENAAVHFNFQPQVRDPGVVIERGDADLLVAPSFLMSPDQPSQLLFHEGFVVLAWANGRFGSGQLTIEQFREAEHMVMMPPTANSASEPEVLVRAGINRTFESYSFNFSSLAPLVVGTDRLATVQRGLAHQARQWFPLHVHALPFESPEIEEHTQWHRHKTAEPGLQWLRNLFYRAADRLTAGTGSISPIDNLK